MISHVPCEVFDGNCDFRVAKCNKYKKKTEMKTFKTHLNNTRYIINVILTNT